MRSIYFLFTVLFIATTVMFGLTSCTDSDSMAVDVFPESFEVIKTRYGAEEISGAMPNACTALSVSTTDMLAVLGTLQENSLELKKCTVESSNDGYFGTGNNESTKKVVMSQQYKPETRSGHTLGDFVLRVVLSFNIENNQVYYLGTDYLYDTDLFEWRANGLSLFPAKASSGLIYEFESESFLFFKLNDRGDMIVKVPIMFKGKYDFESNSGSYNFELQRHD